MLGEAKDFSGSETLQLTLSCQPPSLTFRQDTKDHLWSCIEVIDGQIMRIKLWGPH